MQYLGVTARVALMALVSVIMLLVLGMTGLKVINGEEGDIHDIHETSFPGILALDNARLSLMKARVNAFQAIVLREAQQTKAVENLKTNEADSLKHLDEYERTVSGDEDRRMLGDERQALQAYYSVINDKVMPLALQGQEAQAVDVVARESGNLGKMAMDDLDAHMAFKGRSVDVSTGDALASASVTRPLICGRCMFPATSTVKFTIPAARMLGLNSCASRRSRCPLP